MKKQAAKFAVVIALIFIATACKNEDKLNSKQANTETQQEQLKYNGVKTINIDKGSIYWKGHKLFGSHTGDIKLKEAELVFDDGALTGGQFVADMTTIRVIELMKDENEEEEEEEEDENEEGEDDETDLANHLKNDDFFDAKTYPEAKFVITNVSKQTNGYAIKGDMTIKGKTNQVEFPAQIINEAFKANVAIDRTKFGIKYGSGSFFSNLGDNVIKDKFDLKISLVFR